MTPSDPITPAAPSVSAAYRRPSRWRLAAVGGAAVALLVGAAVTMAASPAPAASPDADASADPVPAWGGPGRHARGMGGVLDGFAGFAGFAGPHGGFAGGNISITAINGASLSLATVDGWTRTIRVTDATTITKDGETASVSDLSVGDRIRFRQAADDDGSYSIVAIDVVVPHVVGQVTGTSANSLTLQQPNGSSVTVRVDGGTTFTVGGETGKALSDIEVGMVVVASGELNDDGSLDAAAVRAGSIWQGLGRGRGNGIGPWGIDPAPTATPDASTEEG